MISLANIRHKIIICFVIHALTLERHSQALQSNIRYQILKQHGPIYLLQTSLRLCSEITYKSLSDIQEISTNSLIDACRKYIKCNKIAPTLFQKETPLQFAVLYGDYLVKNKGYLWVTVYDKRLQKIAIVSQDYKSIYLIESIADQIIKENIETAFNIEAIPTWE